MAKRLDSRRLALWRQYRHAAAAIEASIGEEMAAETDLDMTTFEVLALLDANGGRARMQDLANELVINPSTFTRLIDRLDGRGLVVRELTPNDGRGVEAVMTTRGRRLFLKSRPTYRRAVQRGFARHLTDTDIAALVRILNKVDESTP